MVLAEPTRGRVGTVAIAAIGAGSLAVNLWNLAVASGAVGDAIFGALVPIVSGVGLVAGGVAVWRREYDPAHRTRVGVWTGIGLGVLGLAASLAVVSEAPATFTPRDEGVFVSNAATIGAAVGFVVGLYDVEQQQAQARAEQLTHQLTVLNRLLRHDIRNDANVIRGHAELLARGEGDVERAADTIEEVATDLVELGEEARDVERMIHEQTAPVEFIDLVDAVERALVRTRELHGEFDVETDLPPLALVHAHPMIGTAVSNVVENAVAHHDGEAPHVAVAIERRTVDGESLVELSVADDGPGIPEPEVRVLERGYETALEHTSGLGLWLVNWIVTESGGHLEFAANEPRGSVVTMRLPDAEGERGG